MLLKDGRDCWEKEQKGIKERLYKKADTDAEHLGENRSVTHFLIVFQTKGCICETSKSVQGSPTN